MIKQVCIFISILIIVCNTKGQQVWNSKYVQVLPDGGLRYLADSLGNTIPDFSGVGYRKNRSVWPVIPVAKTVQPNGIDDLKVIQSAIDEISALPLDKDGFRGALF